MYACIYELRKNCCGTGGQTETSKVLQEVLADLKRGCLNMRPACVDLMEKQPDADLYKANNDFIVEKETWQEKEPAKPKGRRHEEFPKSTCLPDRSWGREGPTIFGLSSSKSNYVDFAVLYAKTSHANPIGHHDVVAKTCHALFGTLNFSNKRLPQHLIV